jgi:hypothetical protein
MARLRWKQLSCALALALIGGSALAGESAQRAELELSVSVEIPADAAARQDHVSAAIMSTAAMPRTVRLTAEKNTLLALTPSGSFERSVQVSTNGRSTCVRAVARKRGTNLPMTISLMKSDEKLDPCTGAAPKAPVHDLGTTQQVVAVKVCQIVEGKWGCYKVIKAKGIK